MIVATSGNRQTIADCCARSAAAGVRRGMTLAHARALLQGDGEVSIEPATPQRDAADLDRLAHWSMRFSPTVATDPPDGLLLDITGCQRLFRGEGRLVELLERDVRQLGLATRLAAAPTVGCARAVARFGESACTIVAGNDADVRAALAPLPVAALRIDPDVLDALATIGIERIEHLFNLPRAALPSRFGADLLLRLDQALGQAIETIDPIRPVPPPTVQRVFDGPTTQLEAIQITVHKLIEQLQTLLQQRESGALRLDLHLSRIDAAPVHLTVALSRPSRDPRHLWSLLQPAVEKVDLGYGIEQIDLTATSSGPLPHEQAAVWAEVEAADAQNLSRRCGQMLDRLTTRLGAKRVLWFDVVETHVPERVFVSRPVLESALPGRKRRQARITTAERPSLLLPRPEPIEVIAVSPDGPPSWVKWRGQSQRVVSSQGPERIAGQWWGGSDEATKRRSDEGRAGESRKPGDPGARDYFKVQDEQGRWLWVYRQLESGRWFMHGQWA